MAYRMPDKDPSAILDYEWDWRDWLQEGEAITDYSIVINVGGSDLALGEYSQEGGVVTAWFTGGAHGVTYGATCQITTNAGRTEERSILVPVKNR